MVAILLSSFRSVAWTFVTNINDIICDISPPIYIFVDFSTWNEPHINRNFFEIPALLSCEQGNLEQEKSKYFLNFSTLFSAGFPRSQDKRAEISKTILSFFTLFLYIP